ncbi:hypothetical protein PO909_006687 [Leuciscus waleckii]
MRTFLLLALTLVAINGSKPQNEKIFLREIIENVEKILQDHSDRSQKVRINVDHFGLVMQQKENLCQAAKVLKDTHLNHTVLHRNLFAYATYTGVSLRPIFIH